MLTPLKRWIGFALASSLCLGMGSAYAALPKIAVTDLSYQDKVKEYFHVVSANSKSSVNMRETGNSYAARDQYNAKAESSYFEASGSYTYIDSGELRNYTSDLKGALIKGGGVRLVQARPYVGKPMEQINDIIGRIKQGMYPGADYVLFGTVSSIEFRQESMPLSGSVTASLTLDLVADFSLINTKTFEVKASFSASGSGQDTKILSNAGDRVTHNRGKVISATSKSLAEAAYVQLMEQFDPVRAKRGSNNSTITNYSNVPDPERAPAPVTVY